VGIHVFLDAVWCSLRQMDLRIARHTDLRQPRPGRAGAGMARGHMYLGGVNRTFLRRGFVLLLPLLLLPLLLLVVTATAAQ